MILQTFVKIAAVLAFQGRQLYSVCRILKYLALKNQAKKTVGLVLLLPNFALNL